MESNDRTLKLTTAIWLVLAGLFVAGGYLAFEQGLLTWMNVATAVSVARELVAANLVLALLAYLCLFVGASLLLFPAQLWIIALGGILFDFAVGAAASWTAAVISSVLVFLLARSTLGEFYRKRANRYLERLGAAFQEDQMFYMLTLRFIPVCPYCIANVIPAMLGAGLRRYILTTMLGVAPYVTVYSLAGSKGGDLLDPNFQLELNHVAQELLPVMLGFAALPLIALAARRFLIRRKPANSEPV